MELELTPLEEAHLNAQEFAAGIALSAMVMNLIREGEDHRSAALDRNKTLNERKLALRESKRINSALSVVALTQSVMGIGA